MPRGIPADQTHRAEIVAKIRDEGMSVSLSRYCPNHSKKKAISNSTSTNQKWGEMYVSASAAWVVSLIEKTTTVERH